MYILIDDSDLSRVFLVGNNADPESVFEALKKHKLIKMNETLPIEDRFSFEESINDVVLGVTCYLFPYMNRTYTVTKVNI